MTGQYEERVMLQAKTGAAIMDILSEVDFTTIEVVGLLETVKAVFLQELSEANK